MEAEIWKELPGHAGVSVSSLGGVRTLDRKVLMAHLAVRTVKGRQLKPFISKSTGYLQVKLGGKKYSVHRLVCMAFHGYPRPGEQCNHKDGVRNNNASKNLEWVTASENVKDGYRRGRVHPFLGKSGKQSHFSKAVIGTPVQGGPPRRFNSGLEAVAAGFDGASISRCCTGKSKTHLGFYWRFADG